MQTSIDRPAPNRLAESTSPYLLQHANNPVDWYPWSVEAFDRARRENKPVFLSIGYAACHWCHVMEHESFENPQIAAVLNRAFVSIKVDREERPDVDEIYMQVTQALNDGRGGWPMSVFLTPDKVPFFAGTYYPPDQFATLLERITVAWTDHRDQIDAQGEQVRTYLERWARGPEAQAGLIGRDDVDQAARLIAPYFDDELGGISGGGTNKFPPSMAMELMLRVHQRHGDQSLLPKVEVTLDQMARGGIYDHLGGGICRYSTDIEWLVPHFEKMLYDQALVSSIYLDAFQVTRNTEYAEVAADIFKYVSSDLQSPEGGFYSTRDADSEGLEGAYYIWTVEQATEVLGESDAELFCAFYDVTPGGNWFESRGHAPSGPKSILRIRTPLPGFARQRGLDESDLRKRLAEMRGRMLQARSQRTAPALDDKILTAWNGLMIASLAKGACVLDEPRYAESAARAADFVLAHLRTDGRLLRSYRDGKAHLTAYLDDYAFFIEGLLNLYDATFERRWLDEAAALADLTLQHYHDTEGGGFYYTADDAERLLARSKNPRDGAIPSGNSVHALNLARLSILLDRKEYRQHAEGILRAFKPLADQMPGGFERLLCSADFFHARIQEIAVVGDRTHPDTAELLRTIHAAYRPNKVVVWASGRDAAASPVLPLLAGKTAPGGHPTAYVCENFTCRQPVTAAADLARQLDRK